MTRPAVADEIAGAADLVAGKTSNVPFVVLRGLNPEWLIDADDLGCSTLIRPEDEDMFGLGAREAVLVAATSRGLARGFPEVQPDARDQLLGALGDTARFTDSGTLEVRSKGSSPHALMEAGALRERARIVAVALNLKIDVRVTVCEVSERS